MNLASKSGSGRSVVLVLDESETTLRAGPAGQKKYVLGAFTEDYSLLHLGDRDLGSFRDFGILPDFAGVVVSDRYVSYWHAGWENVAGHQACLAHLLRDYQDAAETYTDAHWPAQAQETELSPPGPGTLVVCQARPFQDTATLTCDPACG